MAPHKSKKKLSAPGPNIISESRPCHKPRGGLGGVAKCDYDFGLFKMDVDASEWILVQLRHSQRDHERRTKVHQTLKNEMFLRVFYFTAHQIIHF